MVVSLSKTIYYEITKNNTNSSVFKDFFEYMLNKLSNKDKDESDFILGNLSCHGAPEMFDFYNTKRLKILFGIPYFIQLNMIEFCFKGIKNTFIKFI